jgi:hypothetical protein
MPSPSSAAPNATRATRWLICPSAFCRTRWAEGFEGRRPGSRCGDMRGTSLVKCPERLIREYSESQAP